MSKLWLAAVAGAVVMWANQVTAAPAHRLLVGARTHVDHSTFEDLPYGDDDVSCAVVYEYHEDASFLQFGLDVAPDVSGQEDVDLVLTPSFSLVFKDGIFRAGLGVLASHVSTEETNDWTDVYWQFLLGIELNLGHGFGVDVYTYYAFEEWSRLDDFDGSDLEFGGLIGYRF